MNGLQGLAYWQCVGRGSRQGQQREWDGPILICPSTPEALHAEGVGRGWRQGEQRYWDCPILHIRHSHGLLTQTHSTDPAHLTHLSP